MISTKNLYSQSINPNGYNYFYYPNGKISSEGNMIEGKADGYWKNYYEDGKIIIHEGHALTSFSRSTFIFNPKTAAQTSCTFNFKYTVCAA